MRRLTQKSTAVVEQAESDIELEIEKLIYLGLAEKLRFEDLSLESF